MKTKKILAMLSAITMMFSATVAYFPTLAGENAIIAKAEEMEEWESPPLDAAEDAEESTGFIEDITVISEPIAILANSEVTDDGWQYYVEGDGITISGYSGTETSLVVPESIDGQAVTAIANRAFADNKKITSIDLGSVQKLGNKVFEGCTGLKEITIPKTVTETGNEYQGGCLQGSSIETVTFEEGIANIPAYICKNASSVKTVIMPEKEDTLDGYVIGSGAFQGTSLQSVTIPESVTAINSNSFQNCALLTDVVIPDNVTWIGNYCFSGCKRLTNIQFGAAVSKMGYKVFEGCTGLKEITIPKTVTETGNEYQGGCLQGSSIETLIIASGMKTVPSYIAKNCTSLKTVNLPDTVTTIGNYAFCGCSNLTKVKSNRTTFNFSAKSFEGCSNLDDKRFTVLDRENNISEFQLRTGKHKRHC